MVLYMKCTTSVLGKLRTLSPELFTYDPDTQTNTQGRIQDTGEGGARFISEQKHPDLGTKRKDKIDIYPVLHRFSFPSVLLRRYSEILGGGG